MKRLILIIPLFLVITSGFKNEINFCFPPQETVGEIIFADEIKERYGFCKDYKREKLVDSGYISEEKGLVLCVGPVEVFFEPNLKFCSKDILKKKITLRRIPYYSADKFSIKDVYRVTPRGLPIAHGFGGDAVFLKKGLSPSDIPYWNKYKRYHYFVDEVDITKPFYIKIENKDESEDFRARCIDMVIEQNSDGKDLDHGPPVVTFGFMGMDDQQFEYRYACPIKDDEINNGIGNIIEKGDKTDTKEKLRKVLLDKWGKVANENPGFISHFGVSYCKTGEYVLRLIYVPK